MERVKRARLMTLLSAAGILTALVAYSVLRPDSEKREVNELKGILLSGKLTPDQRNEIRRRLAKLPPETMGKLVREVMRARLEDFREKYAGLSMDEKRAKVDEVVAKMRKRFSKLSPDARSKMKESLSSEEGKKRMAYAMKFYYENFTAEERSLLDPLVNELSIELNSL